MTDEVANDTGVDEVSSPETSETSTPAVDESAIREQIKAELEANWQKERQGFQSAISAERQKRQEAESRYRSRAESDPNNSQSDVDAIVERKLAERDAQERERREQESLQKTVSSFHQRKADAAKKHDGVNLDEAANAVGNALQHSRDLQMQLMQADHSWDLIAHLHQHPDKLEKLSQLSEVAAGIELGRIEASLGPRPSLTNAPDPITPLSGGSSDVDDIYELDGDRFESALKDRNGGSVFPR